MDVIDDFIAQYRKQYDFYDTAGRLAAGLLEAELQEAGIPAMVTSRPKSVSRLEPKVRARNQTRVDAGQKPYESADEIFKDIVDLAGVRVALYFPGQRDQVEKAISEHFTEIIKREFPKQSERKYDKRFSGYGAEHYRARLKKESLSEAQDRYTAARVEIQVASVLMHAWSEVEHDLVYKQMQGKLSLEEYRLLDTLNGMVLAGELVLESLQDAAGRRVASRGRTFENHFELASYILGRFGALPAVIGRIDDLYDLVVHPDVKITTPEKIDPYLDVISSDFEARPISQQIIDQILNEAPSRYAIYQEILNAKRAQEPFSSEMHSIIGAFILSWTEFERFFREQVAPRLDLQGQRALLLPTGGMLLSAFPTFQGVLLQYDYLRRIRNELVHGVQHFDAKDLIEGTRQITEIREMLQAEIDRRVADAPDEK